MAQAGIYRITVKRAGKPEKYYIGQTSNLHTRKVRHVWELRKGCHRNPALQAAIVGYGESAFKFDILEECVTDKKILSEREKFYIDTHQGRLY
jgi:group I intron endonuclease